MREKYFLGLIICVFILMSACRQKAPERNQISAPSTQEKVIEHTPENFTVAEQELSPMLDIISPKDDDLIKNSTVSVEVDSENFKIVPVGSPVKNGEGHFHVWLDSEKKIGPQTTFIFGNIISGKHSIVAELVKSDHSSLNPIVTKMMTINVVYDYIPEASAKQNETNIEGIGEYTVDVDDHGFYPNKIQAKAGDKVKINFKFRDDSIYYAGLDVKGPFPTIQYKLHGQQPLTAEFTMKGETKITSYWPSTGVKKADLIVEVG